MDTTASRKKNAVRKQTTSINKAGKKLISLVITDIVIGIVNVAFFYGFCKNSKTAVIVAFLLLSISSYAFMSQLLHLEKWKKKTAVLETAQQIIVLVMAGMLFLLFWSILLLATVLF